MRNQLHYIPRQDTLFLRILKGNVLKLLPDRWEGLYSSIFATNLVKCSVSTHSICNAT